MRVTWITEVPESASAFYRIQLFQKALKNRFPWIRHETVNLQGGSSFSPESVDSDIIWLSRVARPEACEWVLKWKNSGRLVHYDIDDYLFQSKDALDVWNAIGGEAESRIREFKALYQVIGGIQQLLPIATSVSASTPRLASAIETIWNKSVHIIPNCMPRSRRQIERVGRQKWDDIRCNMRVRVGLFAGSPTHSQNTRILLTAIEELSHEFCKQVVIVIGGHYDKNLVSRIQSFGLNVETHELLEYWQYREILASCHILAYPLSDLAFNSYKSDVKFSESAQYETLVLASPVGQVRESIQESAGGVLVGNGDWARRLRESVIDSLEMQQSLFQRTAARDFVAKQRAPREILEKLRDIFAYETRNTFYK